MSDTPDRAQEIEDLREDLRALRQRGLHNLGDRGGLKLRRLEMLAREFTVAEPALRRDEALRALLQAACPKIVHDDQERAQDMRDRVERSFGLLKELQGITSASELLKKSVEVRKEKIYKEDTIRELYRDARHALARAVVVLMDEVRATRQLEEVSPYIERPELAATITSAFMSAVEAVCLVGPRGSGKSRLMRSAIDRDVAVGRSNVIWLNAESQFSLHRSLVRVLAQQGLSTAGASIEQLTLDFIGFVVSMPDVLVAIDDVSSWKTIEALVAPAPAAKLFIASNDGEFSLEYPHAVIDVGPMSSSEGSMMARTLIDDHRASHVECDLLAEEVGLLPLAISHAASLVNDGWLAVPDFVEQQRHSALTTYSQRLGNRGERSLTFIYQEILKKLEHDCVPALQLLKLCSPLQSTALPFSLFSGAFDYLAAHRPSSNLSPYAFSIAVAELRRIRILAYQDEEWGMHKLTHQLVSELLDGGGQEVVVAILAAFTEKVTDVLIGGSLNGVSPSELDHAESALIMLFRISREEAAQCRLGRAVNALHKWNVIRGFGGTPLLVGRATKSLVAGGVASDEAELAQLAFANLDMLELTYAHAVQARAKGGDVAKYGRVLMRIAESVRQLADESDLERRVWSQFLEFDGLLEGLNREPPSQIIIDAFSIVRTANDPNTLWLGEGFLRLARKEARAANWDNAAGFCSFAEQNFRKAPDNPSCVHGLLAAQCHLVRATTMLQHPARWGERNRMWQSFKLAFRPLDDHALKKKPVDFLLLDVMGLASETDEYTAVTEHIKLLAMGPKPGREWYEERPEWYLKSRDRLAGITHHQYLEIEHQYALLRFRAAVGIQTFREALDTAEALLMQARQVNDGLMALRLKILSAKLSLLAAGTVEIPVDYATAIVNVVSGVARAAEVQFDRNLYHEATVTAHAALAWAVPDFTARKQIQVQALSDSSIPVNVLDAFGSRDAAVLPWYERVLRGEVHRFGILAF